MTGVRYFTARRAASIATAKQSLGVCGARIGSGASPWRPYMACSRSACSVLVGRPVEGPPRWTSTMISGQLEVDGQADRLGLEVEARTAGRGDAERAAEGGAEGGADAGDLVLGLEGADAELLAPAQLVQDVRGRRDRVAAQEQRQPGQAGGGDQAPGQRLVAGDLDVLALLEGRRLDLVVGLEQLGRLAEVVAGPEGPGVGVGDLGLRAEALGDPLDGGLERTGVQPADQARGRRSSSSARRRGA